MDRAAGCREVREACSNYRKPALSTQLPQQNPARGASSGRPHGANRYFSEVNDFLKEYGYNRGVPANGRSAACRRGIGAGSGRRRRGGVRVERGLYRMKELPVRSK